MHVPSTTQDKLLYQITLMIDLMQGREKPQYAIADGGTLKDYDFSVLGEEKIDTPLGKLDTIKLKRIDDKRHTVIWCAKSLDYLPVRIEQVEKDDANLAMMIREVTGLPVTKAAAPAPDTSE